MNKIILKKFKTILLFVYLIIANNSNAQAPNKISYQAVIRNSSNTLVTNAPVGIRISVIQGTANGNVVMVETHSVNTNANGLVTLEIGTGTPVIGSIGGINWSNGPYFIKSETDPIGGTNYSVVGTSQLLSVPYALFAAKANEISANAQINPNQLSSAGAASNQILKWNGAAWVPQNDNVFDGDSSVNNELQKISRVGGRIVLNQNGGIVSLPDSSVINELQTLTINGNKGRITLSNGGGTIQLADSSASNELQTINRIGGRIRLSLNGGTIALPDSSASNELQTISINGSKGRITLSNNGGTIQLADSSTSNELQSLSRNGGRIILTQNGGTITLPDSSSNNELQTIVLSSDTIKLSQNGGNIKVPFNIYAWGTKGNSGTTSANFIGTLDGDKLQFRVNNNRSGIIDTTLRATAFGYKALANNSALNNTTFGHQSLFSNTSGGANTANGFKSLFSNSTGNYNTAFGGASLSANTSGIANTANGTAALFSNTTGHLNTAIGFDALLSNTTGTSNVAIGGFALSSNTNRSNLVAVGDSALYNNGDGVSNYWEATHNTAIGSKALYSNTKGFYNSANGYQSLFSNITGSSNIANGYKALYTNDSGSFNTAIGNEALFSNTKGEGNSANGYNTLFSNTTGNSNSAFGTYGLFSNTTGKSNTAIGMQALGSNTTGEKNVGIGLSAGFYTTTGSFNTAIGASTFYSGQANYSNTTVLGYQASPIGSNKMVLGNTSVTGIYAQVTSITSISDGRVKENIQQDVPGLDFITKLRPVSYSINIHKQNELMGITDTSHWTEKYNIEKMRFNGLIAQEIEKVMDSTGAKFTGLDKPTEGDNLYHVRYGDLIMPLIKAVQEQQLIIEELKNRLKALEK